ncbi:MAG: type 4a pilus biogenesis protein PilO, partial [Candidatus Caldatribacteriaceae bacterium]
MNFEKNWALYLLIWIGILMVFLFSGIAPVSRKIDVLSQEREILQREVMVLQKRVKQLENLEAQLERLKDIAKTLEGRIPHEKEIPNLLLTIEDASFL